MRRLTLDLAEQQSLHKLQQEELKSEKAERLQIISDYKSTHKLSALKRFIFSLNQY